MHAGCAQKSVWGSSCIHTDKQTLFDIFKKKPVGVPSEFASDAKLECQA